MEKTTSSNLSEFIERLKQGDRESASSILNNISRPQASTAKAIEKASKLYGAYLNPRWASLRVKLLGNRKLNITFINDVGFNAGAGIAMMRQAESFLLHGHRTSVISAKNEENPLRNISHRIKKPDINFLSCEHIVKSTEHSRLEKSLEVIRLVRGTRPDLIITGNFHAYSLPIEIVGALHHSGIPCVVYAHDCDWVTGGCAHFLWYDCKHHSTGCCEEVCKKNRNTYPPLMPSIIASNWSQRTDLFSLDNLPIATNSHWNKSVHSERFGKSPQIQFIPLGLDEETFSPSDKEEARRNLGIPTRKSLSVILTGSCSFDSRGKGGKDLLAVFQAFLANKDVLFIYIGNNKNSELPSNVKALGYLNSPDQIASAYNAADIFLNPVHVESFGQTMLEASACEVPIVSYSTTGTTNISFDNVNALHAQFLSIDDLITKLDTLIDSPATRGRLGRTGRLIVERYFTLSQQYCNWRRFLVDISFINQNTLPYQDHRKTSRLSIAASQDSQKSKQALRSTPLISILTPTYNIGAEFYRTANSIAEQSFQDTEWIVFDGLSDNKESMAIFSECMPLVDTLIKEHDNGIYDALNRCIPHITGDYVIVLGSGDYFANSAVLSQVAQFLASNQVDMLLGNVIEETTDGRFVQAKPHNPRFKLHSLHTSDFSENWLKGYPPHQSTFIRKGVFENFPFNTKYQIAADLDQILRIAACSDMTIEVIDFLVSVYPNGGFSASSTRTWISEVISICSKYATNPTELKNHFSPVYTRQEAVDQKRQLDNSRLSMIPSELLPAYR